MLQLSVPIPNITGRQDIEIDMTVNGKTQKMHFIIEVYPWDSCENETENRINCIRQLVQDYGKDWTIYDIGIPTEKYVPLTFVKTQDWQKQRDALVSAVMG
ncbi:MAG: hypothetical protein KDC80_12235 [Saprospiraceae bacterium]|nr:hypothetical protein [Saprospiraceae bacterium]